MVSLTKNDCNAILSYCKKDSSNMSKEVRQEIAKQLISKDLCACFKSKKHSNDTKKQYTRKRKGKGRKTRRY